MGPIGVLLSHNLFVDLRQRALVWHHLIVDLKMKVEPWNTGGTRLYLELKTALLLLELELGGNLDKKLFQENDISFLL